MIWFGFLMIGLTFMIALMFVLYLPQYFKSVSPFWTLTRLHSTFIPSMSIVFAPPFTSSSASSLRAASIMFISSVILFSPLFLDYQVVLVFWLSPYIELYVAGLLRANFYLYFYKFFSYLYYSFYARRCVLDYA